MTLHALKSGHIRKFLSLVLSSFLLVTLPAGYVLAEQENYLDNASVNAFINEMVSQHGFKSGELKELFKQLSQRPDIIKAISRPAEAMPWYKYRPIFLTESRIQGGVEYWEQHKEILDRAEKKFGVPPEIIVAIIGVESRYGQYKGKYPVMESLATLAFNYPKRSKFFRSELEQYLLLTREEKIDPLILKGSYAGAMGEPQFISSSYRRYAIDFDGDRTRDLWNNTADIIGSVANYFSVHGWKTGQAICAPAIINTKNKNAGVKKNKSNNAGISDKEIHALVELGIKPKQNLDYMKQHGVTTKSKLPGDQLAALIELTTEDSKEYWLGMHNFYVITRYNHSSLYAMAVFQLGNEIVKLRNRQE